MSPHDMHGKTALVAALFFAACADTGALRDAAFVVDAAPDAAPDAALEPLGYIVHGTWLVRESAPTEAVCEGDRIARVRLRVLDADGIILDELVAPCSDGAFEGTTVLPWGTRHYGAWMALAPDGEELQEIPASMPIAAAMPRTALDVAPASFEVRPASFHDYAAGGVATVTGYPDPSACNTAAVARLRLTLWPTDGGDPVVATEPCADGRVFVRTEPLLDYAREYGVTWDALAADGSIAGTVEIDPVRMSSPTRVVFGLDAIF